MFVDGRIVACCPVVEEALLQACCVEYITTACVHVSEMWGEVTIHARGYLFDGILHIAVSSNVISIKVYHDKTDIHTEVVYASKEHHGLVDVNVTLCSPLWVIILDQLIIIVCKMYHGCIELL